MGTTKILVVYGHDYCSQAMVLKKVMDDYGIDYEWRDIREGDPAWQQELKALARGNLSVPTVVFPDQSVLVEPYPGEVLSRLGIKPKNIIDRLTKKFQRNP